MFNGTHRERDLADELANHMALEIEENVRKGISPEEARRQAMIKSGGLEPAKEMYRDRRGVPIVESTLQDLRYGVRALLQNPTFSIVAVVTLALGIGANTAIFSVVKAVLLNQLPYRNPERLVALGESDDDSKRAETIGYATAYDLRRLSHSFDGMSLYRDGSGAIFERGEAEKITGLRVNYDFFNTLGIPMYLGRAFLPEEDRPDRRHEIILSYGLWNRRFGGDKSIISRTIRLNDSSYTVVGVLPANFRTLEIQDAGGTPEMFMPLGYDLSLPYACRDCQHLHLVGRVKSGVTLTEAHAELNTIMSALVKQYPDSYPKTAKVAMEPLQDHLVGSVRTALWVLLGAVGFVLLIACANVANLMLARATRRTKEIALRVALGAGRRRLVRQLLTESLVLAFAGGMAGIALAWAGTSALSRLAPAEVPRLSEVHLDLVVLLFGLGASMFTGLLFGLAPALRLSHVDLNYALKDVGKSTDSRSGFGLRSVLVTVELILAFTLVTGAGLLGKSFLNLLNVDPGYDPHHVLTLSTYVYGTRYQKAEAELGYYEQVMERLRATPGIESVGMSSLLPLASFDRAALHIRDRHPASPAETPSADRYAVSADYFSVMKIPLRRGRRFDRQDQRNSPLVALVSENCARQIFRGEDPIGRQIQMGGRNDKQPWATIVGIVGDVRQYGADQPARSAAYLLQSQDLSYNFFLVARTGGDPARMESAVRGVFASVDPTLPVFRVQPMEAYVSSSLAERSFTLLLLALFGLLALSLAAVGIYGLTSYAVSLRTREVGIRMALGAARSDVLALVLRQGAWLTAAGLGLGLIASLALSRLLGSLLFEVKPADAATSIAAVLLLAVVSLAACYIPARRAASVDPMIALRYE